MDGEVLKCSQVAFKDFGRHKEKEGMKKNEISMWDLLGVRSTEGFWTILMSLTHRSFEIKWVKMCIIFFLPIILCDASLSVWWAHLSICRWWNASWRPWRTCCPGRGPCLSARTAWSRWGQVGAVPARFPSLSGSIWNPKCKNLYKNTKCFQSRGLLLQIYI